MNTKAESEKTKKIITTTCSFDCGGRCILKVHVSNGEIVKIGTDKSRGPGLKACIRGLSQKDVVTSPQRLTRPLRRIGERGSGQFKPISWNKALDEVAYQLNRVKQQFGPDSIFLASYSGNEGAFACNGCRVEIAPDR